MNPQKTASLYKKALIPVTAFALIGVVLFMLSLKRQVVSIRKDVKHYVRKHQKALFLNGFKNTSQFYPKELQGISFADRTGLVTRVKSVSIRGVEAPYNSCLISHNEGYVLFFRYDTLTHEGPFPFYSHIGYVKLNEQFEQGDEEFCTLDTQSQYSEDPRAIQLNNSVYITYNDLLPHSCYCRTIRIAQVDFEKSRARNISILDPHINPIEKNWVPFIYKDKNGIPSIHFQYQFNPHKILKLSDPNKNQLDHLYFVNNPCLKKVPWPERWGIIRGGTPALLVDGQYLSFFHSSFKDQNGLIWYLMGAYTFSPHPPFEITAISQAPILFDGIYGTFPIHSAPPLVRVIFPSGFCEGTENGEAVFHVSCGENDCATKIVTINKDALFKSLRKL